VRYYFLQKNELWFFGDNRESSHLGEYRRHRNEANGLRDKKETRHTPTRDHIWCQIYINISSIIYETIMVLITYTPIHQVTPYMVSNRVAHDVARIWSQYRSAIIPIRHHIWCQIYINISTIIYDTIMVLITHTRAHSLLSYMVSNRVAHDVAVIWCQTQTVLLPIRNHIWS